MIRYALLSPTAIGPALELREGREVVTHDSAVGINRHVRGDIGVSSGIHAFAVAFWGDGAMAGAVSVGVATDDAPLTTYVGGDAESVGYRAGDGQIHTGGASVATVAKAGQRQRITVEVNLDASPQTIRWIVDGLEIHSRSLPAGETWYPAITVSGATAYDLSALFTGGRRAGEIAGSYTWGEDLPSIGDLDIAPVLMDYRTDPTDDPPAQAFFGDLVNAREIGIHSAVSFWPMGGERPNLRGTTLRLRNLEGRYDGLIAFDATGARVALYDGDHRDPLSSQRLVATLVVDSVSVDDDGIIELSLASVLRELDTPWQTRLLPPWVDSAVANRPWPVCIGAARNVPAIFTGRAAGEAQYIAHDRPLAVAQVRDGGDPLDPAASPADYIFIDGGVQVYEDPVHVLTLDASGASDVVIPPGATDELSDKGLFETLVGGVPDGWTSTGDGSATRSGTSGNYVVAINSGSGSENTHLFRFDDLVLDQNTSYRIECEVTEISGEDYPSVGQYSRREIALLSNIGPAYTVLTNVTGPGTFSLPFTNTRTDYCIGFRCHSTQTNPNPAVMVVRNVRLYKIPPAPSIGADSLEGVGLEDYLNSALDRSTVTVPLESPDAAAIDTATGYRIGAWLHNAGTTRDVLDIGLRAFTACLTADETGAMRVARLVDPALALSSSFDIASDQIIGTLRPRPLRMPGLTTSYGVRRNWQVMSSGDFVSDVDPITGVPINVRTQFQRSAQRIIQGTASLSSTYRHADRADILLTAHEDPALAQDEIDRVLSIASTPRWTATITVGWPDAVPLIRAGMICTVQWPQYGFESGRKVYVLESTLRPYANTAELTIMW